MVLALACTNIERFLPRFSPAFRLNTLANTVLPMMMSDGLWCAVGKMGLVTQYILNARGGMWNVDGGWWVVGGGWRMVDGG